MMKCSHAAPAAALTPQGCRPRVRATASASSSSDSSSSSTPAHTAAQQLQRRQLLSLAAAAVLAGVGANPAAADEAEAPAAASAQTMTYTDAEDKFSITVPAGWEQGTGAIGEAGTLTSNQARFSNAAGLRRVVAFVPPGNPQVSVAVTVQFIGPDYTQLSSFGKADDFAAGVVNKMDNSYILRLPEWRRAKENPLQIAKLMSVGEVNRGAKQYVFSYTVEKVGEPLRTVYQSVAMGNNGRYNRLYTVNATTVDAATYGPVLKTIVDSFTPPPLPAM